MLCTDKLPARKNDDPPPQTLRVNLADACDYVMGDSDSHMAAYERATAGEEPALFQTTSWSPFYGHRDLYSHFCYIDCVQVQTQNVTAHRMLCKIVTLILSTDTLQVQTADHQVTPLLHA